MGFKIVDQTEKKIDNPTVVIDTPPKENYYNDENLFRITKENVGEKIKGYVLIPIYWEGDEENEYTIDVDSMMEEFQRTVSGIEGELEQLSLI
jgi:hypothetical protein